MISLPFLDVNVKINDDDEFETCVQRKSSSTGLTQNFCTACSKLWKTSLISYLLYCVKNISSSETVFDTKVKKLKGIFYANIYYL